MVEKLIIIGSGPAGWTAALYSARAELSPVLFEGPQPGGQLTTTTEVENWPGFPDGIDGTEMMSLFKKQAERFGTKVIAEQVTSVDFSERPFTLTTSSQTYEAESVIISTGASAIYLGIPGEERLSGKGVSACATCDGFFFKGQTIVMVGGGDSAAEESTFMTRFADKVYLLVRRDEMRASKIMQQRVKDNPKIEILYNTEAIEVLGEDRVSGVKIKNNKTGEESELYVTGYFAAIGHKPNTSLFKDVLDMDEKGYLVTKPGSSETNIEGVFAAGDVADHKYRQAVTAAGMGCMASLDAERWLSAQK
ncbi:MAG: thioredoxin-disulfide reductase [bacterium]|nr:thioredoxin-disulfide reductase [bacterium]